MTNPFLDEKAAAANNPFIGLDDGIEPTRPGPAVIAAQERQPDAWAEAKRKGARLGVSPEVVERNPAEVRRLELRRSLDEVRQSNPALADWLLRDDNLTLAQDDTESLGFIDRMFNSGEYAARRVPALAGSLAGTVADISERAGDKLTLTIPQWLRGNKNLTDDAIRNERQVEPLFQLADWLKSFEGEQQGMTTFDDVKGNPLNAPSFVAEQVVASAPDMAAAVAALPAYVLSRTGEIANTRAGNDGRTEVTSSDYAAALPAALLEATFERFATGRLFKAGTGTALRRVGKEVAVQAGTEGAEEGFSNLGETVGTKTGFNLQQFADAVGAGALVGAGLGGSVEGTKAAFEQYQGAVEARKRGQQENEQVDALSKIVQKSKLLERDPEKLADAVASLKSSGMSNVYVPAEAVMTLFQSEPDSAQAFAAAGIDQQSVQESLVLGSDVAIPMEAYLVRIAPQYHGALGKAARLSPDAVTDGDIDANDEQDSAVERFLASVNDAPAEGQADMRVYNDVLGQLLGSYSQADAEQMASVVNAFFRDGIGKRAGIDPFEAYQRYGLRVIDEVRQRVMPDRAAPEFDAMVERLRAGDIPTEDQAFGPTIGEFLSDRGIRSAPNEPMSGEIRKLAENDRFTRRGRKRLVREDDPNAMTLDYAREAAVEAGYLPEGSDINDLLDALENDARPITPADANASELRSALLELSDEMGSRGLDPTSMSNAEIRRAMFGGVELDQAAARSPFDGVTREQFLGTPKITSNANAADLVPRARAALDGIEAESFAAGKGLTAKYSADSAAVFDGDKVIASYNDGDTLVVDKKYRRQGIGEELVYQWRTRNPGAKPATTRTKASQSLQKKVWSRIERERATTLNQAPTDQTQTPEFKAWFGDSVVTKYGEPLVVYHGSPDARFMGADATFMSMKDRYADKKGVGAFWFAADRATASSYADDRRAFDYQNAEPAVIAAYLKLENPLVVDGGGKEWREAQAIGKTTDVIEKAQAEGHDGVIIRNVRDNYNNGPRTKPTDTYVVFNSRQIKSATANRGTFDPNDPSILNQERRGYLQFGHDRQFTIGLTKARDLSTFLHEFGHFALEVMGDVAAAESAPGSRSNPLQEEYQGSAPVGAWVYGPDIPGVDRPVYQVRDVDIENIDATEFDSAGEIAPEKRGDAERYAESMRSGDSFPNGRGSELPNGKIKLQDGHRRLWAAKKNGATTIRLAVNPIDASVGHSDIATDYAALLNWLGVSSREEIGTEQHEMFARGFEKYLGEGKPPTPELAGAFARFRAWLRSIYKSLAGLNVELNDEVRGFMARMLAGDDAVVEAERAAVAEPLFKEAARAGMTEAQFTAYLELQARAHDEAEARVTAEAYRETMREREAWWREESKRVEGEVRAEFEALPVYRAWEALARNRAPDGTPLETPPVKLAKQWLLDRYGQDWLNKNLLRRQVYSADGGVHGDVIAPVFGFESGSAMIEALTNAVPLNKAVRAEVEARMRETHGDMRNDGSLPEKAMRAVHGNRRIKLIEAEIAALARLANEPAMTAVQARQWAGRQVAGKRVRDIVPYAYLRAERKAAREALRAAAAGKHVEALAATRRRLANAVMYDEASKARKRVEARTARIKALAKPKAQERLGKAGADFRDAVNGLLAAASIRPLSEAEQARQKPLRAFVERLQEQGEDTAVTEAVLSLVESGRPMTVRDMTVGQFDDVYAAIKNLRHIAGNTGKLLAAADRATLEQAVAAMSARAVETHPDRLPEMLSRRDASTAQLAAERLRRLATELDRPENIIEALDGGESGPWHDYYLGALNTAENTAIGLRKRVGTALRALRKSMPDGFMRSLDEPVEVAGVGPVSRGTLVGMVLNTGNAANLQRFRDGGIHVNGQPVMLDDAQVQAIRDLLTGDEARYVQGLWDAVNSLWPDISALQTEMSGIPPEKVEAQAFEAAGMPMRGGYWPLAYDHSKSDVGERQADDDALRIMMGQAYTRATTPKGHTKARVENLRAPLLLDFGAVMSRHLDNVMTDLAYRKAVKDTVRLLRHPTIKDAVVNRLGKGAYDNLKGQVAYAVSAGDMAGQAASAARQIVSKVVSNSAISALAIRPDIALGNYTSAMVQALDRVGIRSLTRGWWELQRHRGDLTQRISSLSPFMDERLGMIDEDYRVELAKAQGRTGFGEAYRRVMMTLHRWADHDVARAAWWGRYQEALAAGETSAESVRLADKLVRQTQTASARKDVSPIERDPAFRESRMFMGPMFVILGRLRAAARGEGATRNVGARAASIMLQMFLAPSLFMLAAGRWPTDTDDDDEIGVGEWSTWLAANTLLFPLQAIPVLREAAGAVEAWATDRPINPRAAPTAQAVSGLVKASKSISDNVANYRDTGEFDWFDMTRDLATMAGPFTGAPAGQIRVTTKTIEAIQDDPDRDRTELARMALYGPPRQ